jgi:acyl-CoA synthetase (AMP-forming)/AMP-acid ligase II
MDNDSKPWLKSYDSWVKSKIDIPKITLTELVEQTALEFPDRPAFHFFDVMWTYREIMEKADRFANALIEHGMQKGDVLAIHLVNSPQYLIAIAGALKAGVIISGLSPLLMPDEIVYQLADSGAKAVITLDHLFEDRLADVASKIKSLKLILLTNLFDLVPSQKPEQKAKQLPGIEVKWLQDILNQYPDKPPRVKVEAEDICFIQFTGGTTGIPKGAMLTHYNMVANVMQYGHWLDTKRGYDILLCAFPMFHIAGVFHVAQSFAFAFTQLLIPDPRNTEHIIQLMNVHRPTFIAIVPALSIMLLKEPGFRELDFSKLQIFMCGAAPFPEKKAMELSAVIGANKLVEVFGMTETAPLLTANPRDGIKKVGSIGIPLPSTRLKLVDLESGEKEVPKGQEGEIIAAGPQIMKGYYNNPEESRIALREHEGELWVHTGDVARKDEDGFFFIVDRAKDMINVGGYKVFSTEVEHKLSKHPAIELCAVIGTNNPKRAGSELVKLVVEKCKSAADKPDESIREDILVFAREKLAPYKVPKIVEFMRTIPLTSVGKVNKKALRNN